MIILFIVTAYEEKSDVLPQLQSQVYGPSTEITDISVSHQLLEL